MITVNWSCDMEQGHEDTMMGSHPGGRAGDLTLGREGTALASGDQKYSENLRSTIEEHRPCQFRSSTIGGCQSRECTGHHATCGALPGAGPYLRLSRFQGLTNPCAGAVHMEPFPSSAFKVLI
ncbi:hypothetical protein YC2023_066199 [Brassica napus]